MTFFNVFGLTFAVLLWGFLHTVTASQPFKAWVRQQVGPVIDRYYRLAYNLLAVGSFLAVLVVAALTPDRTLYVARFPWVALMIVIEILALAGLVLTLRQTDVLDFIGVRQLSGPKNKHPSALVKDGLYRYVRHPLYSCGLVLIWLFPLMTARVLVFDLAITVYVVIGAYFEEHKLMQRFGPEYREYAAVTPMFIPFLKLKRSPAPARPD